MAYKKNTRSKSADDELMDDFAQDFGSKTKADSSGSARLIVTILIIVLIIVGGWYLLNRYTSLNLPGPGSSLSISGSNWQAVFLTNGQVYFGKIKKIDDSNLVLTDIYYLQVISRPIQGTQDGSSTQTNQQPQQELSLFKLGNELHGPKDTMFINRDHVLLIEELKEDSRVVQAIDNYINNQ